MSRLSRRSAERLAPEGWEVKRTPCGVEFRPKAGARAYVDILVGRATPSYISAKHELEEGSEDIIEPRTVLAATDEKVADALPEYVEAVREYRDS